MIICQNNCNFNFADYSRKRTYAPNDRYLTWKVI